MPRNRNHQAGGIRLGLALKTGALCAIIVFCCVGYVWQKTQIDDLGDQIRKREARFADLRDQNDKLRQQWGVLLLPHTLDQRVHELNLGLMPPQVTQIWRLPEPPAPSTAIADEQQLTARLSLAR